MGIAAGFDLWLPAVKSKVAWEVAAFRDRAEVVQDQTIQGLFVASSHGDT